VERSVSSASLCSCFYLVLRACQVSLAKREAEAGQLSEFSLFFLVAGSGCVCVCVFWQGWENEGEESLRSWVAKSL